MLMKFFDWIAPLHCLVDMIIYKITRSFIFEEKKSKMLHFLYNYIFDNTNKQSSSE